jgi:hypothetical protein
MCDRRLKNADYDNEYETQGLWCAASIAEFAFPGGVKATRQAFFYVPSGKPGDPLPGHQDPSLLRQCRVLTLWYEVDNPAGPGELAKTVSADLGASLGSADEPSRFKRTDGDWGSGYWSPYRVWERANRRIVLAVDPGGPIPIPDAHTRLLVIARSSLAPRGLSFDWSGGSPKGQPSLQGAAEGARVAHLENPCSFDDGHNNWQGGLISFGEKLLRDFPASRVHNDIEPRQSSGCWPRYFDGLYFVGGACRRSSLIDGGQPLRIQGAVDGGCPHHRAESGAVQNQSGIGPQLRGRHYKRRQTD